MPIICTPCRRRLPPVLAFLAACAVAGLAGSPAAAAPHAAAEPDSALARALARIAGEPLTLEQALLTAVTGSTDAQFARTELDAARSALRRERGGFDPELFGDLARGASDQPTASLFAGASVLESEQTTGGAGLRLRTRWGTELTASLDAVRLETNNAYASLRPQYDAAGRLELRQPLLKGFGAAAGGNLTAAERSYEAALAAHDDAVLGVRAVIETAYWQLHGALRDLAVQQLLRDQAASLLSETRVRADAGLIGPGQVASARVFLAEQEQAVLDRRESLDQVSDSFAALIGRRPQGGANRYLTADAPPLAHAVPDEEAAVSAALSSNLGLRSAERSVAALQALADAAAGNARPRLDLLGSLGGVGLAGSGRQIVSPFGADPETIRTADIGGLGESLDQAVRRTYPNWSVGVSFSLPLGGRAGGGERDRIRAVAAGAELQLEAARRDLERRVRADCRELAANRDRLVLADEGVAASREQVRIGLVEFRNGRTTAFELVRLAADLAAAQQRHSQTLVRAARAAADLRRLTADGSITKESGQ
ncbi:MAG: TolC family protein [Candidatus Latescibacteria bacterium]|nr:TolC family protein [Candidatus Latescibacterota bacterium]